MRTAIDILWRQAHNENVLKVMFQIVSNTLWVIIMTNERIVSAKRIIDEQGPIVRTSVLKECKLCSRDIAELISEKHITKIKTGYYTWSSGFENLGDMEIAASVIKNGVVCMFSAAQFYELTTVNPIAVNIAVPFAGKLPILPVYPPIKLYRIAKSIFHIGITEVESGDTKIRIYDKERTVCDFFRMRMQYGEDVALEVIKNYMSGKGKNIQTLLEYAAKMRIKKVIKPYMEALL